ncbi:MAG: protein kinase [Pseudomonadota bacterium]
MAGKHALTAGTMLAHYRIERVLGQGGFGITYLAHDTELNRKVAIKECFPRDFVSRDGTSIVPTGTREKVDFDWALGKFVDEATTLARFRHPGIVAVLQILREENNSAYMVLEFVDGVSLHEWLEGLGRIPTEYEIKQVMGPMVDALQAVHEHQIVHRDVAPDNIFIRTTGEAVLLDFGAARQTVTQHSRSMNLVVKDGYSAPEQYYAEGRQGPWTDVYAFAAVIYRAMTGKRPVDAMARLDAINNGEADPMVAISDVVPAGTYTPGFVAAVEAGLAPQVKMRPQSLAEWRGDLIGQTVAPVEATRLEKPNSRPVAAGSSSPRSRTSSSDVGKKRRAMPLVAAAMMIAAGAGAFVYFQQQQQIASLDERWQQAVTQDTQAGYRAFLSDNEDAPQAPQARTILRNYAQPWSRVAGSAADEQANALAVSGETIVAAGTVTGDDGNGMDGIVRAYSMAGRERWKRQFGGRGNQVVHDIIILDDGSMVVAGVSREGAPASDRGFMINMAADGEIRWRRALGNARGSGIYAVMAQNDGSVIGVGYDADGPAGGTDGWIVAVDKQGDMIWERHAGGDTDDRFFAVADATQGRLALAGESDDKFWVTTQDENGETLLERRAGGPRSDRLLDVAIGVDSTVYAVGETYSFSADGVDAMIMRILPNGKSPPNAIMDDGDDYLTAVAVAPDNSVYVSGYTSSRGAGKTDGWLRKYDASLERLIWERVVGGEGWETIRSMAILPDDSVVLAGSTNSFGVATTSTWVLRISEDGQYTAN